MAPVGAEHKQVLSRKTGCLDSDSLGQIHLL